MTVKTAAPGSDDNNKRYFIAIRKPLYVQTARELSGLGAERRKFARKEKEALIDRLLAELYDYMSLARQFGDEAFRERVKEICEKLAEVCEK